MFLVFLGFPLIVLVVNGIGLSEDVGELYLSICRLVFFLLRWDLNRQRVIELMVFPRSHAQKLFITELLVLVRRTCSRRFQRLVFALQIDRPPFDTFLLLEAYLFVLAAVVRVIMIQNVLSQYCLTYDFLGDQRPRPVVDFGTSSIQRIHGKVRRPQCREKLLVHGVEEVDVFQEVVRGVVVFYGLRPLCNLSALVLRVQLSFITFVDDLLIGYTILAHYVTNLLFVLRHIAVVYVLVFPGGLVLLFIELIHDVHFHDIFGFCSLYIILLVHGGRQELLGGVPRPDFLVTLKSSSLSLGRLPVRLIGHGIVQVVLGGGGTVGVLVTITDLGI